MKDGNEPSGQGDGSAVGLAPGVGTSIVPFKPDNAGISSDPWPKRRPVTGEQVQLFALLLRDFLREASGTALRDLPSYDRLILAAYACGFVCTDMSGARAMMGVERDPAVLLAMPFRQVRLYVHALMRAERWNDYGADFGGGHIQEALASGALRLLAERLDPTA